MATSTVYLRKEGGGREGGGREGGRVGEGKEGEERVREEDRGDQKGGKKYNPAVWRYAATVQHPYHPVVTWYLLIQQNETSLRLIPTASHSILQP